MKLLAFTFRPSSKVVFTDSPTLSLAGSGAFMSRPKGVFKIIKKRAFFPRLLFGRGIGHVGKLLKFWLIGYVIFMASCTSLSSLVQIWEYPSPITALHQEDEIYCDEHYAIKVHHTSGKYIRCEDYDEYWKAREAGRHVENLEFELKPIKGEG